MDVGARVGVGVNRFAPDNAALRCALPGRRFGLARDTVFGRLFPNEKFLERLVTALLSEVSDEWETGNIYLNMKN